MKAAYYLFSTLFILIFLINLPLIMNQQLHKAIITDKYIVNNKPWIETTAGNFTVTNQAITLDFNMQEIYAKIRVGQCYLIKTRGIDSDFFGIKPNVIAVKRMDCTW